MAADLLSSVIFRADPSEMLDCSPSCRQVFRGPHGGLGAISHTDLAQDSFDVNLDCRLCDIKLSRNDLVRRSLSQAVQNVSLP